MTSRLPVVTELSLGVYEQLVTVWLEERLRSLDPQRVHRARLDPADAHEMLSRHIAALARRALRAVGGDDAGGLARQVELTNLIATAIAAAAPGSTDPN